PLLILGAMQLRQPRSILVAGTPLSSRPATSEKDAKLLDMVSSLQEEVRTLKVKLEDSDKSLADAQRREGQAADARSIAEAHVRDVARQSSTPQTPSAHPSVAEVQRKDQV